MHQNHHHSCYRLFGAVDFMFSVFNFVLWVILYQRSEGLIRLQFEVYSKNDSMIERIHVYKANIRSIGSLNDDSSAGETLHDEYNKVQEACQSYNSFQHIFHPIDDVDHDHKAALKNYTNRNRTDKGANDGISADAHNNSKKDKIRKELQMYLDLLVLLILLALGMFMLLDFLMVCSTRDGKASSKNFILIIFLLQIISNILYVCASLELHLDFKFCAPSIALRPMLFVIIVTAMIYKPYQLYILFVYYKDVKLKIYVDELEIDSEDTASSTSGDYEFEKGLGITDRNNNTNDDERGAAVGVVRQINFTDLTQHPKEQQNETINTTAAAEAEVNPVPVPVGSMQGLLKGIIRYKVSPSPQQIT